MSMQSTGKSLLDRFLGLFAEVHAGEGRLSLLMTLNIFLILTAYYIAKVVREPLILAGGGAEVKAYSAALQAIVLIGAVNLYSLMVARFDRRRLLNIVCLFFTLCFVVFYFLGLANTQYLGVIYYVWVGVFSLTVIAQFWSFANDIYTAAEGKRLFAIIAFGGSAGAVAGAKLAEVLLDAIGIYELLLVSAALLLVSLLLTNYVESRKRARIEPQEQHGSLPEPPMSKSGAFQVVFRYRYLLLIAVMILLTNWVNTTGEYILGNVVSKAAQASVSGIADVDAAKAAEKVYIGKFYGDYFFYVNLLGFLLQLFVVSRVVKYLGIRVAIMVLPFIALGGYVLIAFTPLISLIRLAKTAENASDYSLNNTARQMLFLPTTREQKYKAKVAIDSFFVRAGDVLSAALVYAGLHWLGFSLTQFALVNLVLVGAWLVLAFYVGRENQQLMQP
jgi:ATP:ADP antiporter, AAA family